MRRGVLDLVLDFIAEDSENVSFEGRFGNCLSGVGTRLERKC